MYNDNKYFSLYKTMYNFLIHENICCHYTRRCITFLYMKMYFLLYETMYNFLIHENVFLIIRDDV